MKITNLFLFWVICLFQSPIFAQDAPLAIPAGNWYSTTTKEMFMIDWNEKGQYIDKIYYAKAGANFARYEIMSQTSIDVPDGAMGSYKGYKVKTYLSANPNVVFHLNVVMTPVSIDIEVVTNGNKATLRTFSNIGKSGSSIVNVLKNIKPQIKEMITQGEYDASTKDAESLGTVKFDFQEGTDEPSVTITYANGTTEEGMASIDANTHVLSFNLKPYGKVNCKMSNMGIAIGFDMFNASGVAVGILMPK